MKKLFRAIIDFAIKLIETSKPVVMILIAGVLIMAVMTGHKYYQFTKTNPGYCELCHLMKEPIKSWQKSSHKDIVCQSCHSMTLLAQNRLLLSYVVSGSEDRPPEDHGRITPWNGCNSCHLDDATQGSITLRKSYGHARHVFMEKIECKRCHTDDIHNFSPDEKNCLTCHKDKLVHGIGMEGFACLSCHVYGDTTAMPKKERCLSCHKDIPGLGFMTKIDCRNCHKPHKKILPTSKDCLGNCHINQESIGRHDKHIDISCLACHKAHIWKVGKEESLTLCAKCHEYRDPMSFIF